MSKYQYSNARVCIEEDNPSIVRDDSKCIMCGICKNVCKEQINVHGFYDLEKTGDKAICVNCGQCTLACPMSCLNEVEDYKKVSDIIKNKDKIVIFQTSPSIRIAIGETFNQPSGTNYEGKIVSALKKLGANYVFDTTFGADLTIMEEVSELVSRIQNKEILPMFTSCCPAWVKYVETFMPEYIPHLSTAKSPILMQGSIIKTYFAKEHNLDPEKIINVAVTPCTAKKAEIKREEMNKAGLYHNNASMRDIDYVITNRELIKWLREENIDFLNLEESQYDNMLNRGSGAGLIFGNSGGVMEAALRTAYKFITDEDAPCEFLDYKPVRGLEGIKDATVNIANLKLKIAVVSGISNIKTLLNKIKEEHLQYDFIEVMTCPGGCIAGGGQPKTSNSTSEETKTKRTEGLYSLDKTAKIRTSYSNPDIIKVYSDFLGKPLGKISHQLLHTTYQNRSSDLDVEKELV